MAVTFFPFNSIVVDGVPDRPANAENLAAYLAGFFSNGVLMQEDTALKVEAYSGMEVQIHAGMGNINGKTILSDAAEIVTLATANASLDRIDRVVFRLDKVKRLMEFDVLTGTPASNPAAPALTQTADIYELCLAEIRVPAGASEILASYITDTRVDIELCGAANIPKHIHNTAEDRQNINFIGRNPIASIEEDTTATWAAFGTGVAFIDANGVITNKPNATGGFIFNQVTGDLVFQTWYAMNGASSVLSRSGNVNGWYSNSANWVRSLNERNGAQFALLWQNASPTSSFAGQSVNVDATDYDLFIVICKATAGANTYHKSQIAPKGKQMLIQWTANDNNTTALMYCRRLITVSDSSITSTDCTSKQGTTISDPNNSYLIPFAVYGIKGVQ